MDRVLTDLEDLLALSTPLGRDGDEAVRLQVRLEQVLAEYETLRLSHAEVINLAVAEREERLREQDEHMRRLGAMHQQNEMILNSAGEGILGVDHGGCATFINPAAARLLGWEPEEELSGRSLQDLIVIPRPGGATASWEECPLHATLTHGDAFSSEYGELRRADGKTFPIEFTSVPIREARAIVGAVMTFRDITERRLLEAQLRQAQKLESIGQLAAGIAHEINTPTQYIGDNMRFLDEAFGELAPLLRSAALATPASPPGAASPGAEAAPAADVDYLLEEIPKAIRQSLDGLERVATIVRSMKEFSHPGGDRVQSVDLRRALESTLTVSRNEWKYVAEVATDFDPDLPLITCLAGDLNQVLLNLIVNAAHAIADKVGRSGEKGTIAVQTKRRGDWAEIRLGDTGTGIPAAIREKIFDPFFTTKEVGRGTGQGLAIARSVVVEKHGGTLEFETVSGQGTTFIIRLPIHQPSSVETTTGP